MMNLTPRQKKILELIWCGYSNQEIADDLHITTKGVEFHIAKLYKQFPVENRIALCRAAIAAGVLK